MIGAHDGISLVGVAERLAPGDQLALVVSGYSPQFLVSYTRARAEALGLRGDVGIGSRAERVVVITAGLVLAPWHVLPWAIYLLTATAWITVLQRIFSVRTQLRGPHA